MSPLNVVDIRHRTGEYRCFPVAGSQDMSIVIDDDRVWRWEHRCLVAGTDVSLENPKLPGGTSLTIGHMYGAANWVTLNSTIACSRCQKHGEIKKSRWISFF